MPQVRKNPLPVGRYFIWIMAASQGIFDLWLKKNADIVTVEQKQENYDQELSVPDVVPPGMPDPSPIGKPDSTFYVFALKEPAIWPRGVGFPNDAPANVTKQADVIKRPPVPTAVDVVKDIAQSAAEAALEMRNRLLVIGALYLAWQWEKNSKGNGR